MDTLHVQMEKTLRAQSFFLSLRIYLGKRAFGRIENRIAFLRLRSITSSHAAFVAAL